LRSRSIPEPGLTTLGNLDLFERLGEGGRSTAYRGKREGRDVAIKVYKDLALAKHLRKMGGNLAEFEFERNRSFFQAPGLAPYVAEPIDCLVTDEYSAIVQELLVGDLYYFFRQKRGAEAVIELRPHLERIVELAHAADLFDLDMHSLNVMVVEENGTAIPKLFDFNLIPFHVRPPNPIVALLLTLGLLNPRSRDRRLLRNFDRAGKRHRKLLRYFPGS